MRNLTRALFAMPVLALTACGGGDGSEAAPILSAQLGQEFILGNGESATVDSVSVEFTAVVEDSRCPLGTSVMCVWEGNARVLVTATRGPLSQVFTLNTAPSMGNLAIFAGHVIELRKLDPWPTTPTPPTSFQNYQVTLMVDGHASI
jgi:hypothetical protein